MRNESSKFLASVLVLALPFVVAAPASGQQPAANQEACMASFTPASVHAGQPAVQVTAKFSQSVGRVTDVKGSEGSGVSLTSKEGLGRVELSRNQDQDQTPQPIEMAQDMNSATIWLNLQKAQSGEQQITIEGADGNCTGTLTVKAKGGN